MSGELIAAHFMDRSADAAAHLAKAMLGRRGVEPYPTHDAKLASRAALRGHPNLAESIRRIAGITRTDHVAALLRKDDSYCRAAERRRRAADSLRHAVKRLPSVIEELERELESAVRDPQFAAAAFLAARTAAESANRLASDLRQDLGRDSEKSAGIQSEEWQAPLARVRIPLLSALTQMAERLRAVAEPGGGRSSDTGRSRRPSTEFGVP